MKVSSISNSNYPNYTIRDKNPANTNFRGFISALVVIAGKQGYNAIKSTDKVKYLSELQKCVSSCNTNEFIAGVKAVSKTPDSYYNDAHQGWASWTSLVMCKDILRYIDELRFLSLKDLDRIPDNNYVNVQTKKDLIKSLFENGHEISKTLVEQFSQLKDSLYSTFKLEVMDTCFFSSRYNSSRKRKLDISSRSDFFYEYDLAEPPAPFGNDNRAVAAYGNLSLLSTLDRSIYGNYFRNKRAIIDHQKLVVKSLIDRNQDPYGFGDFLREDYERNIKSL